MVPRPTIGSLNQWADEVGNDSYRWDNFLPYYRKSCAYTPFDRNLYNGTILDEPVEAFSATGGPLHVSFSNYADAFGSWAQKAFRAVGLTLLPSFNTGILNGSAYSTVTIDPRNGHRSSSESSFLQAALQNGTAPTIYKNTLANRILFSASNKTAAGVSVTTASTFGTKPLNFTLSARKEVILSAGVFQSPQLLMLSGIGPPSTLSTHQIPLVQPLPGVGQNMWDHVYFGANRRVNVLTASASANSPALAHRLADLFRTNASGPLAAFGAGYYGWEKLPEPYRGRLSARAREDLSRQRFAGDWPEVEWLPVSAYLGYQTNPQEEDPRDGFNYAVISAGLLTPLSRGNVTIGSNSAADAPVISPNWLQDPTDREVAVAAFRRSREIWAELAELGVTVGKEEYLPGLNVTSDEDILDYVQRSFMTVWHASSTCKMGKVGGGDEMAVVDPQCRVHGVQGLRVVDASAFPFLPPGHPQGTVYALAEKIAAEILEGLSNGGGSGGGSFETGGGYDLSGYYANQELVLEHQRLYGGGNGSFLQAAAQSHGRRLEKGWGLVMLGALTAISGLWVGCLS